MIDDSKNYKSVLRMICSLNKTENMTSICFLITTSFTKNLYLSREIVQKFAQFPTSQIPEPLTETKA